MATVTSKDGTKIAYIKTGSGPALVLVDGALCHRTFGPSSSLSKLLQSNFTVYTYDRRGRGESTDTQPYALEREIEDLEAIIDSVSQPVFIFGQSSGGVLAIEAAKVLGGKVSKLAVYECPLFVDNSREPMPAGFMDMLHTNIKQGKNGEAVKQFMRLVGVPSFFVAIMPLMPMWKKLKAVAPTLVYDFTFMAPYQHGRPLKVGQWSGVKALTLVMVGGKSPTWMLHAAEQVAAAIPGARSQVIEGQNHMVKANVLAPVLTGFFMDGTKKSLSALVVGKAPQMPV